ncbi:Mth938-like domain-containing protein [Ideonella sp. BN130291]|uniref:Mth938-like domain-containing protein n=1 Tax=Ideonella sp. BN130291 TaxID=3112940 RepID=UPI002E259355|nr:Mth938-like domain-containing protein [Ideonella sp. BN130291]
MLHRKTYNLTIGVILKIQPDRLDGGVNAISRHETGCVWVNATAHEHSLLVPWRGEVAAWPARQLQELTAAHFEQVLALRPELVIFGSGSRLRFVAPALYRSLIARGIGMETMDTAAACRTYNVLAAEGRPVVAALLIESGPDAGS